MAKSTKGLPPARARLHEQKTQIEQANEALWRLQIGSQRLKADLEKAQRTRNELNRLIEQDADSLLDRVKAGTEWALTQFAGRPVQDLASRLAASEHQIAVAQKATNAIASEISEVQSKLGTLHKETPSLVRAAVVEASSGIFADYQAIIDDFLDTATQLAALEKYLGRGRHGRTIAVFPDFNRTSGLDDMPIALNSHDIAAAEREFEKFGAALLVEPLAHASLLKFARPSGRAEDDVQYDQRHPLERQIIDAEFAKGTDRK